MIDLFAPEEIEVHIDYTGKKLWINGPDGCLLRAGNIKNLSILDDRLLTEEQEENK